ncbi:MAG TPA: tRNA (adenosine(37)-N6)-threonylcarbamoyltransferase complex ATPase subunit type 1 TsaE [Gammaproteobacteria bacterium]|nr:tRNA (adenosine(37)-N6)-threonylcarbamoyltransferase complex ATPase subunit type 1 TsaE [Gammaproteobacteria bacterium]|tara:strand:- start:3586 stop:4098 length:513 start_codon:yes stop_codon:yes gene_type:complete
MEYQTRLESEIDTIAFGMTLAESLFEGGRIYIKGDLGAGKTTLCRGILRRFGFEGAVKSPTFTLVEPYELPELSIYHFDMYRLSDPSELEYIGVDEYFQPGNLCLVEWPERAQDRLPTGDLEIQLSIIGRSRNVLLRSIANESLCQEVAKRHRLKSSAIGHKLTVGDDPD